MSKNATTNDMEAHINPTQEIKEGVMVRWPQFPDRLYIVNKTNMNFCGHDDYCEIETIDHKWKAIVRIGGLVWDDVDYIEY